jgi:hypothetical protein
MAAKTTSTTDKHHGDKQKPERRHAKKTQDVRIQARRKRVSELLLEAKTYREIAKAVGAKSIKTIFDDVTAIFGEWQKQSVNNVDQWVNAELANISRTECEAWAAWERSKKNAETRTTKRVKGGIETTFTSKGQVGDPRFLDVINACRDDRCELLGLNKPRKVEVSDALSAEEMEAVRRKRWQQSQSAFAAMRESSGDA